MPDISSKTSVNIYERLYQQKWGHTKEFAMKSAMESKYVNFKNFIIFDKFKLHFYISLDWAIYHNILDFKKKKN